jgi:hypothetical protein
MSMTMKNIQSILPAVLLCLLLVLAIAPATALPDAAGTCTRSYLIELSLSPAGISERAVQIVYGYSPLPEGTGTLSGVITGPGGKNLSEFRLHDPRIQFGDEIQASEDGKNRTALTGIYRTENHASLVIMVPVTADARAFSLYDQSGHLMKTVDLTKAENRATWNCTPDYGIPARNYPPGNASGLPMVLVAGVLVLVLAVGSGWYLLKKRSENKQ